MTKNKNLKILITGADGFIGKNISVKLSEQPDIEIIKFVRGDSDEKLKSHINDSDTIIHLAGENRPDNEDAFKINYYLTEKICEFIRLENRNIPIIFASSTQVTMDNLYSKSKLAAEKYLSELAMKNNNTVKIYRLPGVFGKWCKPNYNSVVATFCHNIARDIDIIVNNDAAKIELVYIDDLADDILKDINKKESGLSWGKLSKSYEISVGELAKKIYAFKESRNSLISEKVGLGLTRALYSTYISYLPIDSFIYDLPNHGDERGHFVEILKTIDSGQFSFLTIKPGITRGNHYHHSKTEKFLVVKGKAKLRFRHMISNERHELVISDDKIQIIDTIPGWVHDVTNIGKDDVIMLLWANEIFDIKNPDTITQDV